MAVPYVHEMLHEMYSYSEGTLLSFPRAQGQERENDNSLPSSADIANMYNDSN